MQLLHLCMLHSCLACTTKTTFTHNTTVILKQKHTWLYTFTYVRRLIYIYIFFSFNVVLIHRHQSGYRADKQVQTLAIQNNLLKRYYVSRMIKPVVIGKRKGRAPHGSLFRVIMRSAEDGGTHLTNGNIIADSKWGPPAERHQHYYCDLSLSCCCIASCQWEDMSYDNGTDQTFTASVYQRLCRKSDGLE